MTDETIKTTLDVLIRCVTNDDTPLKGQDLDDLAREVGHWLGRARVWAEELRAELKDLKEQLAAEQARNEALKEEAEELADDNEGMATEIADLRAYLANTDEPED
jgi:hypothetical protein